MICQDGQYLIRIRKLTIHRTKSHSVIFTNTLIFLFLMIAILGFTTNLARAAVVATPSSLNFGEITVNSSSTSTVTVTNTGSQDLINIVATIAGIAGDAFSQTGNCASAVLISGQSCTIQVTFSPLVAGLASDNLGITAFEIDGGPVSDSVSLIGTGIAGVLEVLPTTLDFGQVPVNSNSAIQQVTISNPGSGVLNLETMSISGEFSETNTCGQTLAAGESCVVNITYNPLTAGNMTGSLNITANDGATPQSATVSLTGFGTVASLSASPGALNFGETDVGGSSSSQEVTVTNTGNEPLTFTSVALTGEFTSTDNCSATINPDESCAFVLTYQPQTGGDTVGSLNIIMQGFYSQTNLSATVTLSGSAAVDQAYVQELLLPYAGSNPSVISTTIVIADSCTSGRASVTLQEDCNALIQAAESGDAGTSKALLEITPERAIKASRLIHQAGLTQLSNSISRILELRRGASGFSIAGLSLNINEQTLSGDHLSSLLNAGDTGGAAGSEEGLFGPKWGGFITGTIVSGDKDSTSLESGLDFNTKGILAGIDYRFTDQFVIGGAIGYTKIDTDLDNDGGELDSDGYSLTAYGTYYEKNYFVDFSMSYGSNDFDQERLMSYQLQNQGSTTQLAKARYDGDMFTLFAAGGFDFNHGSWMFGPRLSLEYIDTEVDDFTEKMSNPGGSGAGWATHIDDTDQQWLTLKMGGKVSYAHSTSWGVLTPYAGIDWLHEFKNDSQVINGNFVQDPGSMSFNIYSEDPDEDYFQLTVGVSAVLPGGMIGYLNYDTILSNDLWSRDTVNAGIRMEF